MKNFDFKNILRQDFGSVAMIVFGALLLINPDLGSAALSAVLGWVLVAAGAIGLAVSILSKPRLSNGTIAVCVVILWLGIYLLEHPLMLAKILGLAMGIILLKQGSEHWLEAKQVQKAGGPYILSLLISTAIVVIGLKLILSPLSTSRLFMTLGGAFLIACGIGNIIQHQKIRGYLEDRDYDPNIIDADN